MADLDDLREGADFGLGINCENQSFHVKGAENLPWGMRTRIHLLPIRYLCGIGALFT